MKCVKLPISIIFCRFRHANETRTVPKVVCLLLTLSTTFYVIGKFVGHKLHPIDNLDVVDAGNRPAGSASANNFPTTSEIYVPGWNADSRESCKKSTFITVIVISAPDHKEQRHAIRLGWGKEAKERKDITFLFLVGLPEDQETLQSLQGENTMHGDLAINNIKDVYHNLGLKTISALNWVKSFCPQTQYLLKSDDDMFIQVMRLGFMLRAISMSMRGQPIILGNVASDWKPVRNKQSKYYVDERQYESDLYPPFVTGPAYIMSMEAIDPILTVAMNHSYVFLEDVFLTGICAELASVPRRVSVEFRNNAVAIPPQFLGCTLQRTIAIHKVSPKDQIALAEMAKDPQCGKRKFG